MECRARRARSTMASMLPSVAERPCLFRDRSVPALRPAFAIVWGCRARGCCGGNGNSWWCGVWFLVGG
eukprot:4422274-Prymnesium_polylepis.1